MPRCTAPSALVLTSRATLKIHKICPKYKKRTFYCLHVVNISGARLFFKTARTVLISRFWTYFPTLFSSFSLLFSKQPGLPQKPVFFLLIFQFYFSSVFLNVFQNSQGCFKIRVLDCFKILFLDLFSKLFLSVFLDLFFQNSRDCFKNRILDLFSNFFQFFLINFNTARTTYNSCFWTYFPYLFGFSNFVPVFYIV